MASVHEKISNIKLEKDNYIKFSRGYRRYLLHIVRAPVCQGNPPNTFFVMCCHFGWCSAPPEGPSYLRDRFQRLSTIEAIIEACESYVNYTERLAAEMKCS